MKSRLLGYCDVFTKTVITMKLTVKIIGALMFILWLTPGCQPVNYEEMYKPMLEKYLGFWNTGNLEGVEDVLHPDFKLYQVPDFKPIVGIVAFKEEIKKSRDINFWVKMDELNYSKDLVSLRWTCGGSYPDSTGALNNKVQVQGLSLIHLRDGKVLDEWVAFDIKFWMEQLGYKMAK